MSKGNDGLVQRGGALPRGALTLEEASLLPSLVGKNHMTVRRALESARVGRWLPEGARHWRILYDAERVREIGLAWALVNGSEIPNRIESTYEPEDRPTTDPSHGPREGWATVAEIQAALSAHDIDGTYFYEGRWLRERLLVLGVPSEVRVVTTRRQRVFPLDQAIAALMADPLVKKKLGK